MFPLYDENPTELFPIFTILLIAASIGAWIYLQGAGLSGDTLAGSVCALGLIPAELTGAPARDLGTGFGEGLGCPLGGLTWATILTSMFLHGSWAHLLGNLWFLWIFGNNVEDSMGRLRFVVFYIMCGVAAAFAQVLSDPGSPIPMVGASGAISGIMGAYLVLYPRVRIFTLFFFFIFVRVFPLPAWLILGEWFVIQLLSSLADPFQGTGGVAFWAHSGGFVAGAALVKVFENRTLTSAKRAHVKLQRNEIRHGGWW